MWPKWAYAIVTALSSLLCVLTLRDLHTTYRDGVMVCPDDTISRNGTCIALPVDPIVVEKVHVNAHWFYYIHSTLVFLYCIAFASSTFIRARGFVPTHPGWLD